MDNELWIFFPLFYCGVSSHFTHLETLTPLPSIKGPPMFFSFLTWRSFFLRGCFSPQEIFCAGGFCPNWAAPICSRCLHPDEWGCVVRWLRCGSCASDCRCIVVTSGATADCPTWPPALTRRCLHPGDMKWWSDAASILCHVLALIDVWLCCIIAAVWHVTTVRHTPYKGMPGTAYGAIPLLRWKIW